MTKDFLKENGIDKETVIYADSGNAWQLDRLLQEYADQQTKELQQRVEQLQFELKAADSDYHYKTKALTDEIEELKKQPKQVESECEAVELNIKLTEYCHKCGDGCCTNYGTITAINGEELPCHNQDAETILKQVLEHLGYKVNIETVTDYD